MYLEMDVRVEDSRDEFDCGRDERVLFRHREGELEGPVDIGRVVGALDVGGPLVDVVLVADEADLGVRRRLPQNLLVLLEQP